MSVFSKSQHKIKKMWLRFIEMYGDEWAHRELGLWGYLEVPLALVAAFCDTSTHIIERKLGPKGPPFVLLFLNHMPPLVRISLRFLTLKENIQSGRKN